MQSPSSGNCISKNKNILKIIRIMSRYSLWIESHVSANKSLRETDLRRGPAFRGMAINKGGFHDF